MRKAVLLLAALAISACTSQRAPSLFTPFPPVAPEDAVVRTAEDALAVARSHLTVKADTSELLLSAAVVSEGAGEWGVYVPYRLSEGEARLPPGIALRVSKATGEAVVVPGR